MKYSITQMDFKTEMRVELLKTNFSVSAYTSFHYRCLKRNEELEQIIIQTAIEEIGLFNNKVMTYRQLKNIRRPKAKNKSKERT